MSDVRPECGMSTVVNHVGENGHAKEAYLMPTCRTSTFGFDTVEEAWDVFAGKVTASSLSVRVENVEDLVADLADTLTATG